MKQDVFLVGVQHAGGLRYYDLAVRNRVEQSE